MAETNHNISTSSENNSDNLKELDAIAHNQSRRLNLQTPGGRHTQTNQCNGKMGKMQNNNGN